MNRKIFFAAACCAALAWPAHAQDTPTYGGPRVEARIAYEWVSSGIRGTREFGERGTFGDDSSTQDQALGAEIGYDVPMERLVIGAYAGIEHTSATVVTSGRPAYSFKTGRNFTLGARAGVQLEPGAMLYVKGGYSNGRLRPVLGTGANPALFTGFERNRSGWHIGGGAEMPIRSRMYVRADYVHTRYKAFEISATDEEVPFSRHQLWGALGIRF